MSMHKVTLPDCHSSIEFTGDAGREAALDWWPLQFKCITLSLIIPAPCTGNAEAKKYAKKSLAYKIFNLLILLMEYIFLIIMRVCS